MLNIVMPNGASFGWGICGKMIASEIKKQLPIQFYTSKFSQQSIQDEFIYHHLKTCVHPIENAPFSGKERPALQAIADHEMNAWGPDFSSGFRMGYTFFENNCLSNTAIQNAQKFDCIATGSTWCSDVLQSFGIKNTFPVLQGIDTQVFHPANNLKRHFQDKFVIFSGGKFEFRKAQDIVIAVVKRLMEKYDDVLFVNSWYNLWPQTMQSIAHSPHIKTVNKQGTFTEIINAILAVNGIDLNRVITLPLLPNAQMASIYKNTDIGLFPNRCEGGTNLVLMEYLACGKATIVSNFSGHCDIVTEKNSLRITNAHEVQLKNNGVTTAIWQEPDIDETYALLEQAYINREKLQTFGSTAGRDLQQYTWENTAINFIRIFENQGISLKLI
ncbi:MAG: glycosyltransferase family 1 protein [Calditrichaeota bacterium]|nr:MAG: glycosyltransferase family 1 protein [Calditrichota bacterium]